VGLPPSPVEFSSHHHFYKLSHCWLLGVCHRSCLFWLACLFTAHVGSGSSPLSCGVFLSLPLLQVFPLLACATAPAFSSWLVVRDFPSPSFGTQGAPPSLLHVFFVVIGYYSVFFSFFPGWGSVCPGSYADLAQGCLWECHVPLSSPCDLHLPKQSWCWHLAAMWEPSWFLCLTWSGDTMRRCEGVKVLPLLSGFSCKVYFQHLSKILL
jgi:hypothetical protein